MVPRGCLGTALLLLLASTCAALRIEPSAFPGAWVVRKGQPVDDQALRSIVSSATVLVYVRYAATRDPSALATVRVQGGEETPYSSHWLALSPPAAGQLRVQEGAMFEAIEVTVHTKRQLYSVTVSGYGDLAVDHDVLATDDPRASISVTAEGAGDVYLPPQVKLRVAAVTLESRGFGSVRLVASEADVDSVSLRVRGAGAVNMHAQNLNVASAVSVDVASSGVVSLSAGTLHAQQLNASTRGNGDALLRVDQAWSSAVAQCDYVATSSGRIQAGSVACADATVQSAGAGDVIVCVRNALAYRATSFGNVFYTAPRPHLVTMSDTQSRPILPATSSESSLPRPSWPDRYALPAHTPLDTSDEDGAANDLDVNTDDTPSKPSFPWRITGLIAVVVVVVAARNAWHNRRHGSGKEKARLLSDDAPVYV